MPVFKMRAHIQNNLNSALFSSVNQTVQGHNNIKLKIPCLSTLHALKKKLTSNIEMKSHEVRLVRYWILLT